MNSTELAKKVAANLKGSAAKAKKFEDMVAVSFSLISEADENIYVAVVNGKLDVAPYRYDDNNCEAEASAEIIDKMFSGALSFDKALSEGSVQVKRGDPAKLKALECLVPSGKAASKPAAKKTTSKTASKTAAPKAAAKPAAAPKAAKPAETPKAAAKPAAAPKAAAKPAEAPKVAAKPAEAPKAAVKPEAPKAAAKPEAPKAAVKPEAPKAADKKPGKK